MRGGERKRRLPRSEGKFSTHFLFISFFLPKNATRWFVCTIQCVSNCNVSITIWRKERVDSSAPVGTDKAREPWIAAGQWDDCRCVRRRSSETSAWKHTHLVVFQKLLCLTARPLTRTAVRSHALVPSLLQTATCVT